MQSGGFAEGKTNVQTKIVLCCLSNAYLISLFISLTLVLFSSMRIGYWVLNLKNAVQISGLLQLTGSTEFIGLQRYQIATADTVFVL